MMPPIPGSWRAQVGGEIAKPYFRQLREFVGRERESFEVYPPERETFRALELTPFRKVSVLLLGQDPYPGPRQAHGLAFSVKRGVAVPASLRNIYAELKTDVRGFRVPGHGNLESWAGQGVLLLNAVLTVRRGEPNSHRGRGWETFTDAIISRVSDRSDPAVFVLWGAYARRKAKLIDGGRHQIIEGVHPSPLSARRGFFGSRPFSRINRALRAAGRPEIDWQIPGE